MSVKQETSIEAPGVIAERIARHNLDSERVSVTQFSDIVDAIAKALRNERKARDETIQSALDDLQSENVTPNLFRLGALGRQDVEAAIEKLAAIRKGDR